MWFWDVYAELKLYREQFLTCLQQAGLTAAGIEGRARDGCSC